MNVKNSEKKLLSVIEKNFIAKNLQKLPCCVYIDYYIPDGVYTGKNQYIDLFCEKTLKISSFFVLF